MDAHLDTLMTTRLRQYSMGRTVSDCGGKVNCRSRDTGLSTPPGDGYIRRMTQSFPSSDWPSLLAPSLAEMEQLAHAMLAGLPAHFRALCEGVVIRVDDFPTDEVLESMDIESEFDLLGLFQGVGLPQRGIGESGQMPNMVWLYRRPILDYWAEHEETLGDIVRHVLIHEIGHHFGLSDDDMYEIERLAE